MIIKINNLNKISQNNQTGEIINNKIQSNSVKGMKENNSSEKKSKFKLKINKKVVIILIFLFLGIIGVLFALDRFSSYSSRVEKYDEQGNKIDVCDNILNPKCWTEAFRPQLRQSDGFTGVLIVGVDTRAGSSGLMNTDSLIAIIFNHATQEISMISVPRDFWSTSYSAKINAVYAYTYKKGKSEKNDEFYYLREEISKLVGKPLQYTALVRFEGVINLVNALGGVEVCPADSFTAQYPIEKAKPGTAQWTYHPFIKGCQSVDGLNALIYARFRYASKGPDYLRSDFSRARRQQEVIDAIKVKALSDNSPLEEKAENYWNIFQTLSQNITVDITFEDLMAGLSFINTFDRKPVGIVLDPNFGSINKFIYTDSNPSQGYTIKPRDKSYGAIRDEIAKIWKFSAFYKERPVIVLRNQTGDKNLSNENIAIKLKNDTSYYGGFDVYNDAKTDKFYDIKLFDFTAGNKPKSLEYIKIFLGVTDVETLPEQYGITRSKKNEDFLIVVGPKKPADTPTPTTQTSPTPSSN